MRAMRTTACAIQITFHGLKPSEELRHEIRDRVAWLEQFYPPLMACRVKLQIPHRHRRRGRHIHVTVVMKVSGRPPLVITQEPSLQDARVAVREAFDAARRRLEDVYGDERVRVTDQVRVSRVGRRSAPTPLVP